MPEAKLTAEEIDALRWVLQTVVVKQRTGEVGIMHGADRFVSTRLVLKQPERGALEAVARKVGLSGVRTYAG